MTKDEIVAALECGAQAIERSGDPMDARILRDFAARVGEGQEILLNESSGRWDYVHPGSGPRNPSERKVVVIDISDGGKPTTADEILAKMKPLPQAPDDGGKQT